jgi:FkbM family methyltransferase
MGIEVRKFPSSAFQPVSVFHLAVHFLMHTRGPALAFAQVGANDGVFGDPLRPYVTAHPWRGILVEPQPDVFAQLVKNYALCADRLIFENAAISAERSELVLYKAPGTLAKDTVYASSVASSDPLVIARQLKIPPAKLERLVTPCLSLDALLAKHGFSRLDILQIDVEGYDWQVLRTLDLERTSPAIIQFEAGHLSLADCDRAVTHLTRHDYEIYWGGYQGDVLALKRGIYSPSAN